MVLHPNPNSTTRCLLAGAAAHRYAAAEDAADPSHRPAAAALAQRLPPTGTDDPERRRLLDSVSTGAASRAGWIDGGALAMAEPPNSRHGATP